MRSSSRISGIKRKSESKIKNKDHGLDYVGGRDVRI